MGGTIKKPLNISIKQQLYNTATIFKIFEKIDYVRKTKTFFLVPPETTNFQEQRTYS